MNARTLCLGILSFGNATGYEIKKMVEDGMFNHFIEASYGSIYPALTRMTEDGLLTCREEIQTGRPDKKVYAITQAGRTELEATLSEHPRDDKFKSEFLFIMLLSKNLPRTHVAQIYLKRLEDVRAEYDMIRKMAGECDEAGTRFVTGYGLAIFEAKIKYLEENAAFAGLDASAVTGSVVSGTTHSETDGRDAAE